MLGGPSALEQPSTSWGSTGAQQTNQTLPESPAVGSIPHCNHPSTSYPQAAVTPAANDKVPADPRKIPYRVILSKDPPAPIISQQQAHGSNTSANKDKPNEGDHCSVPSTSFAETPRQSSSASSEEQPGDMTSSTTSPYRRIQFTIKLPMKKAQRLKRIATFQPQTLRKIGVSRLKLKNEDALSISDPPPQPPPQAPPPRPETAARTEAELRLESRPQPPPGGFAPHPGVPPEGAPPMPMAPRPAQLNNNSPLLVNLLSNQPQGREGVPTNGPPSAHPGVQRSFSPYQYPPQTPHPVPGTPGAMDPQQMAVMQQQHQERQRMIMQQQHQQHLQAQHAAAMQAQSQGHPPPGTPGCMPGQQQPFFNPAPHQQVRQQVPVQYPSAPGQHPPPQAMYPPQQQPRMAPPQYPTGNPQMAQTPQFMARPQETPEPPQPANKKKRKPTKRQQQKEAEMAAAAHQQAAQQQFMAQQGMMQQQQHMQHPMPMMGQNFGQGYPPQYGYPPGATPQQQQMWQHQMQQQQQRMMYHQQQQAQGGQWHQRPPVPYPPGTPMEAPGSVHPVSQRPSSEFGGTDGTSPMTPHNSFGQQQQQPGMVNGAFMRHDSHGNLFNFAQPAQQQPSTDPVDQLWAKDDSCADLDDLDNIDIKPMGDLGNLNPADLLDDSTTSTISLDKQNAPSTPNGDRIDSSIASVVEMVSKSNTQPTMTNVSQATAMSGSDFRLQQQGQFTGGPPYALQQSLQPAPEQQQQAGRQQPPAKMAKLEQNGSLANGHHQLPNGATKRSATSNDDDEQIGQYVKSLMVAEERKKAAETGTKAKTQRKSRKKTDTVKEELEEGSWSRPAHFQGLSRNQQQMIKQQGQQKQ